MNQSLLIILGVLNIPAYGLFASVLFGRTGILEAIKYLFIPDIISALRGEWVTDRWAQLMFILWIFLSGSLVFAEYTIIERYVPSLFTFFGSISFT